MDNCTLAISFPNPPFPLVQSIEFEMGETFSIIASVDEDDTCHESNSALIEVHDFDATLVGRSCVDVVVTMSTILDMVDNLSPDPLDVVHTLLSSGPYFHPSELHAQVFDKLLQAFIASKVVV